MNVRYICDLTVTFGCAWLIRRWVLMNITWLGLNQSVEQFIVDHIWMSHVQWCIVCILSSLCCQ